MQKQLSSFLCRGGFKKKGGCGGGVKKTFSETETFDLKAPDGNINPRKWCLVLEQYKKEEGKKKIKKKDVSPESTGWVTLTLVNGL